MFQQLSTFTKSTYLLLGILLFFSGSLYSQTTKTSGTDGNWTQVNWNPAGIPAVEDDVIINSRVVIPEGTTVEVKNVEIAKDGILVVNGTLKIKGNLEMSHNSSVFEMGNKAYVLVDGNFSASNQVSISVSSYLIIYGDFIKTGSSAQGDLTVEGGNIYIFGEVDDNWNNFETCEQYQGDTGAIEAEQCDYGTGQNFEDNQDSFPDDLVDLVNCYDLSISNITACPGGSATLSLDNPELTDVTFQWQVREDEAWENLDVYTSSLSLTNITNFERKYRVVVKPTGDSTCKISISRTVEIQPIQEVIWTGTVDSNWHNPNNWSCNSVPTLETDVAILGDSPNYPVITAGNNALAKDLEIETGASVQVTNNWLRIAGNFSNAGVLNATAGSISFEGASEQYIPAEAFEENSLQNLNVKNPAGVISEGVIQVTNSVKVEEGIFYTGDTLLLISNESGTAYINGTGNGNISGTVTMQRYISNAFGYKYFSTPFSNSTVNDLGAFLELKNSQTGFPHVYEYLEGRKDEAEGDLTGWQKYLDPSAPLEKAKGYAINLSGEANPLTLEISGEVNNGTVTVELQNNNGTYTNGFNLVGNPYPSPIDWNILISNIDGIDNAVHFFTADGANRYTGTYTSYVNGVSTDDRSSNIIPSMQGFFVRVSDPLDGNYPATATLKFTNEVRTGNQVTQNFYQSPKKTVVPQIRFTAGFSGEKASDATVIYLKDGATPGFEKDLDAQKLLNTAIEVPSLYSLTQKQEKLAINAVSVENLPTVEIPLGISAEKAGEMILSITETENIPVSLQLYLKDTKKNVILDLSKDPNYSFTSQKGENNNRFFLLLTSEKLSEQELNTSEAFSAVAGPGEITVNPNLGKNATGKIFLSNLSGQILQKRTFHGEEEIKFGGLTAPGIYLVSMEWEKNRSTKKVLLKR